MNNDIGVVSAINSITNHMLGHYEEPPSGQKVSSKTPEIIPDSRAPKNMGTDAKAIYDPSLPLGAMDIVYSNSLGAKIASPAPWTNTSSI
jgi:hypothetical protein